MAINDTKRYYWLKLDKDFFKSHRVKIVEAMPNGKDYILFYLKLLCESTSHEGYLRFSPTIPYNEQMLSTITDTNIDIVRSATKIFTELGMMKFLDDGTLYLEEVNKMIGTETGAAQRKRIERCKGDNEGQCPQEIDIEIEKEIDNISPLNDKNLTHECEKNEILFSCLDNKASLIIDKAREDPNFDFETFKDWFIGSNIKSKANPSAYFTKAFDKVMETCGFSKSHDIDLQEMIRIAKTPWIEGE